MDQDSFRRLLQTPHARPAGSTTPTGFNKPKPKAVASTQPAFKPRKIKKAATEKEYRDRAAERRAGEGNDYAEVESVLEDFEKRTAGQDKSTLEAQRRYLGGDSTHTVLVKGLDIALLEQNLARAATTTTEDDDRLEQAFLEGPSTSSAPKTFKKRTREELIRELKGKRERGADAGTDSAAAGQDEPREKQKQKTREEEGRVLEEAKRAGKFLPIGFKPIGGDDTKKKKPKVAVDKDGEKKKRKKKLRDETAKLETKKDVPLSSPRVVTAAPITAAPIPTPKAEEPKEPELVAITEDFDIFADAGDYGGLQVSDSDASENEREESQLHESKRETEDDDDAEMGVPRRWFDTRSPEPKPEPPMPDVLKSVLKAPSGQGQDDGIEEDEGSAEALPTRLVPLTSSVLPSIKDFLAMEAAASGSGKRKKRKGGAGGGGGGGGDGKKAAETKVERDYKRLKSYTEKKTGA